MEDGRAHRRHVGVGGRELLAKYFLKLGARELEAEVEEDGAGLRVNVGNGWQAIDLKRLGGSPRYALTLPGRTVDVLAREAKEGLEVVIDRVTYAVGTARPRKGRGKPDEDDDGHFEDGKWTLLSPITGSVVDVRVATGDAVEAGAILMIVEAMKMQNELRSRVAGKVTALKAEKGQRVDTGTVLAEVSAAPEAPP